MSRSDNTMLARLWEEELEEQYGRHRCFVILNSQSRAQRNGNLSFKQRERRRWWHGERRRVKNGLRNAQYRQHSLYGADQPVETRTRHGILWDIL